MSLESRFNAFVRNPVGGILLMVLLSFIVIYFLGVQVARAYIMIVLAFLLSDVFSSLFVRGGRGILQIRIFGTEAQPRGYGLIAFFVMIIGTAILADLLSGWILDFVAGSFSDWRVALGAAIELALLVYADMYARFYSR